MYSYGSAQRLNNTASAVATARVATKLPLELNNIREIPAAIVLGWAREDTAARAVHVPPTTPHCLGQRAFLIASTRLGLAQKEQPRSRRGIHRVVSGRNANVLPGNIVSRYIEEVERGKELPDPGGNTVETIEGQA